MDRETAKRIEAEAEYDSLQDPDDIERVGDWAKEEYEYINFKRELNINNYGR